MTKYGLIKHTRVSQGRVKERILALTFETQEEATQYARTSLLYQTNDKNISYEVVKLSHKTYIIKGA